MSNRAGLLLTSALLLMLSAALTACNAGQTTTLTGPEIVRKVRDTMRDANTSEGTVQVEVTLNKEGIKTLIGDIMNLTGMPKGGTGMALDEGINKLPDKASADLRVWKENPNKGRVEVDSSTLPGMKGAALVSDGNKVYAYTPLDNTVRTASLDALEKAREAMKDRGSSMMGPGMGFLSGFEDPEVAFDKLLDASDIRLVSEEKLNGRDTYKLEATPKTDAATRLGIPAFAARYAENIIKGTKATLWVDKDLFTPLKATLEHPSIGNLTYTGDWKLNGPIDADRFVLQVPPGAKVEDMDEHLNNLDRSSGYWVGQHVEPKTITIAEARELAQKDGWKLLEPSYLPQGATLVEIVRLPGFNFEDLPTKSGTGFILTYSTPQYDFSINQLGWEGDAPGNSIERRWESFALLLSDDEGITSRPGFDPKEHMREINVRGIKGTLFAPPGNKIVALSWLEQNKLWIVIEGKLSEDAALKIAEGLK